MRPRYRDTSPTLDDYAARQEERWNDGRSAVAAEWQPATNRSTNRRKPAAYDKAALFLKELSRIIRYEGGGGAYRKSDGAKYVLAAIPSIAAQCGGFEGLEQHPMQFEEEVYRWRDFLVPDVFDEDIDAIVRDALNDAEAKHSRFLRADQTAALIGLTMETRSELGVTQIGAIDLSKADRERLRATKAKVRAQRNRAKRPGYTPRDKCKTAWVRAMAIELNRDEKTIRRRLDRGTLTYPEPSADGGVQVSFAADFYRCGANENGTAVEQPGSARVQRDSPAPDEAAALARIRACGRTKPNTASPAVAVALPGGKLEIPRDLFSDVGHADTTAGAMASAASAAVAGWTSGMIPDAVIAIIEAKAVAEGLTDRTAVARAIGIDRGTWSNAARREFGLGSGKTALVKRWLMAA